MRNYTLFLFLLPLFFSGYSQSNKIDSLQKVWLNANNNDSVRAKAINYLVWHYCFVNPDSALKLNNDEIKFATKLKKDMYIGHAFANRALIFNTLSSYDSSIAVIKKARKYYEKVKYSKGIGKTFAGEGSVYIYTGNFLMAQKMYLQAQDYYEKINEITELGSVYANLGIVFKSFKNYTKALEYQRKAIEIYEKQNDYFRLAYPYKSIGDIMDLQKKYDSATYYYDKAFYFCEKSGNKAMLGTLVCNIGIMKGAQGKPKEAIIEYEKAIALEEKQNNEYMLSVIYSNLSQSYLDLKDYKKALTTGRRGLDYANKIESNNEIMINSWMVALAYEGIGDKSNAFNYFKTYMTWKDSLLNEEKISELAVKDATYEYDKEKLADSLKNVNEQNLIHEKVKIKEKEIKQGNIIRYLLIGGLLLVVLFAFFFYKRLKLTQKQKKIIEEQKKLVEHQRELVDEKQKEILDSIHYAKRIQNTLLAHEDFVNENLVNNFILFNPKDIVSGDFYWATKRDNLFYLAVCDSTGHGVPGAFMSLLNIGFLSEAINEKDILEPNKVFDYVRNRLINSLGKEGQKDGFDGILLCFNTITNSITYAAAHNEPILISNNTIIELERDKMPVGIGERKENFALYTIDAKQGDTLYLYTDGFADQFGGPKGKKFKYKQLNELLLSINSKTLNEQSKLLRETFDNWRGNLEQVDDVCIIGIKI
jgi:serine phosphatase RsbU (regulator of sigma subunit)